MVDLDGNPVQYRCPRTGRMAQPQLPQRRETKPLTAVGNESVEAAARQLISRLRKVEDT